MQKRWNILTADDARVNALAAIFENKPYTV